MRFELKRATATFGVFHPREEKNKGMAVDIPFRVTTDAIDMLPMLMPAQIMENESEFSQETFLKELFTPEGHPRRPSINPIAVHRKPEGASVWIWDEASGGRKKDALMLKPCSLRKIIVTLQTPFQLAISGQIQYSQYNDEELVRLNSLSNKSFDLAVLIEQFDMFDAEESQQTETEDGESSSGSQSESDSEDEQSEE